VKKKRKPTNNLFSKFVVVILLYAILFNFLWIFDSTLSKIYDFATQQKRVSVFDSKSFEQILFEELPESEKRKFEHKTCETQDYAGMIFLKISWFERYKNIIGTTKAYELLNPKRVLENKIRIPNLNKTQYLLIAPETLNIYEQLLLELEEKELNAANLTIASAFRTPAYNKIVGGATCSQHQYGTALDLTVGDINNDGSADRKDRKLIYDILNKKLVKNKGGIGTYKHAPRLIHFDTRGKRARW
jgi:hypothetical protein